MLIKFNQCSKNYKKVTSKIYLTSPEINKSLYFEERGREVGQDEINGRQRLGESSGRGRKDREKREEIEEHFN